MSIANPTVNAWILPSEDEPANTGYQDSNSCFQSLVRNGVYRSVDMLFICFFNIVPAGNSFTLELGAASHPGGVSNEQYMDWIIADARAANPDIRILATLGYGGNQISQMFGSGDEASVLAQFASNLVAYLQSKGMDGFDIDWEYPLSDETSQDQFKQTFTAVGKAFADAGMILSACPNVPSNLDPDTVNTYFDILTLQLYGAASKSGFVGAGISADLLAYGAKFESTGNGITRPYQTAQQAYQGFSADGYIGITQWRLNSGDYEYEQAEQMILYQLVKGTGDSFDDGPIISAAGNPPMTSLTVRHGEVLDAIQTTSTGTFDGQALQPYALLQHGGNGGSADTITLAQGETITAVTGYTGVWYGWNCVLQITIETSAGNSYGPYGSMAGATSKSPFSLTPPSGQSILAFSGSTETVPLAGGGQTAIIASLDACYG